MTLDVCVGYPSLCVCLCVCRVWRTTPTSTGSIWWRPTTTCSTKTSKPHASYCSGVNGCRDAHTPIHTQAGAFYLHLSIRGVRVLPRSLPLWQELFRLECMQLHRRLLAIQRRQQQQRGNNENNENGDTPGEEIDDVRGDVDDALSDISPLLSPLGVVVKGALGHLDTAQRDAFRAHVEKLLGSFLDGRSEVDTIRQIFE